MCSERSFSIAVKELALNRKYYLLKTTCSSSSIGKALKLYAQGCELISTLVRNISQN